MSEVLPQLDSTWFFSQIFWTLCFFLLSYCINFYLIRLLSKSKNFSDAAIKSIETQAIQIDKASNKVDLLIQNAYESRKIDFQTKVHDLESLYKREYEHQLQDIENYIYEKDIDLSKLKTLL